ncbi:MAG TPA: UvrD-helicase domain-containing protein [Candidatus Binatia bacterium]|nr:UvrD-helicase domain-containing protein [Candidatus Binatia bacterium]
MTEKPLADAEARRRICDELDRTFFVEAAAGTGKTTALVSRILALIRTGTAELERIVALTFTEKAAGEMKLRLRAAIEGARNGAATRPDERAYLDRALAQLELARIGTIHAFCADLLHERPVEAGVDPLFEVAAEDQSRALLDGAFDGWFERELSDPHPGVRRILSRRGAWNGRNGPRELLRSAVDALAEHRDFPAAWRRDPFDRAAAIDRILERFAEVAPLAERALRAGDWLAKSFGEIARFVDENRLRELVRPRDHDALEAELRQFARGMPRARHWGWRGRSASYGHDLTREDARAARDAVKQELDALVAACEADLAPLLQRELRPVIDEYARRKASAGKLDFLDLLLRARDLLRGDREVRADFQRRFTHFFVDEFQDTDPLQAEILLLLAADAERDTDWQRATPAPGKLFIVGDPKQSIYRFRRADVALYERVKRHLVARGAELLHLTTSFRGVAAIQGLVNVAFAPHMQGSEDGSQADYVPLERRREDVADRPAVVVLPAPNPYRDYGDNAPMQSGCIADSYADAAAAFVSWLVEKSGWTIEDPLRPGERVRIAARHVCLLFRRFQNYGDDVTRPYVRALEARRLPHVLVGGRSFHEREEILAIRNALAAIEWPDDELRVFATLRGPLFALGDDALLAFRDRVKRLHPLRRLGDDELAALGAPERAVAGALDVLGRLYAGRNHRPIAHTIGRLLDAVRAHAGIAIWPTGEQALANCLRTIDLARRFERRGAASFRAFVDHLEAEAERGQSEDAPLVEESTEGVRIMTVHRAKGLEFPVVVLADPVCNATSARPQRHVDPERGLWAEPLAGAAPVELLEAADEELRRDAAEAVRVAYVATTRARDLLVVPGVGDLAPDDDLGRGWLEVLNDAVYPPHGERASAKVAPGCPPFGRDTVAQRPPLARPEHDPIRPGLHRPTADGPAVVWWDPTKLDLGLQDDVGLRQMRILEADEKGSAAEEGARAHARWQEARARALADGGAPSLRAEPATLRAAAAVAGEGLGTATPADRVDRVAVALEKAEIELPRPGGKRFGALVHGVLAAVDLTAGRDAIRATARTQGRLVGASAEEVAAAAAAVERALAHPILRRAARAARSGAVRRETPVVLRASDGALVEGVIDLAFRERADGGVVWTVVDFKTDRELEGRIAAYEEQVRLYASAIAAATGEPARAVLLAV